MYSNPKNSDCERIVFLEDTIQAIYNIMKHIGCDISDKDSMPIQQLVGREISKRGIITDGIYQVGTRVALKSCLRLRGIIVESQNCKELLGYGVIIIRKYGVIWDKNNKINYYTGLQIIEEKLLPI